MTAIVNDFCEALLASDHKGVLKKYFQQYHICYYEFQDTTIHL